jgi:hypothetical protein
MDDVAGREVAADGDHCLADRQAIGPQAAAQGAAGVENGRAATAMDGAVDSAATIQAAVGGIDDGVDGVIGQIADIQTDAVVKVVLQGCAHGTGLGFPECYGQRQKKPKNEKRGPIPVSARIPVVKINITKLRYKQTLISLR